MAACFDFEEPRESQSILELNFQQVRSEEEDLIQRKRELRSGEEGRGGRRFALAFSGGGIRAAAFQSGVLWRLARTGRLKDVDYFSAVSGGAYIAAAFASHAHAADAPKQGEQLDSWYRSVVAKTISRMQDNAGDFVRDPFKASKHSNSGILPRVFDVPLLLLTFAFTVIIVPIELLIVYIVPVTEGLYLFFGAALRITVCSTDAKQHWKVLSDWSPFGTLVVTFEACLIATFVIWLLGFLPPFQLGEKEKDGRHRCNGYLWRNAAMAFLTRLTIALLVLAVYVIIVPSMQLFSYDEAMRNITNNTKGGFCMQYMSMGGQSIMRPGAELGCANIHNGRTWYRDANLVSMSSLSPEKKWALQHGEKLPDHTFNLAESVLKNSKSVMSFLMGLLAIILVGAAVLVPFFPGLFLAVLWVAGPLVVFCLVAILLQYRIFGPLTGQPLFFSWFPFREQSWDRFVKLCLCLSLVVVPFYNDLRRFWHWFYLRSLRKSFFARGADISFTEIGDSPYCPLLMFTGTVSDYKQPGEEETISEISFSPLHTGSDSTGYVRTPRYRTLAKCTALTGAGCLDAITLSIENHLRFRFWLEMLNLSWGDYILFVRRERRAFLRLAELAGKRFERPVLWALHRLPTLCFWFAIFGLVWGSWTMSGSSSPTVCSRSKGLMGAAAILVITIFGLSFFGFNDYFSWLLFSPIIRQMHQATQFFFQGHSPPPLLYVTDGGVKDCTSIVQLIRRRCDRILLVLAAADPNDELAVLRTAMEVAVSERLCSFYDPEDPKRDVRVLLEEYQQNPEQRYMHLGVRFGWGEAEEASLGTLIIVKNRLPPSMADLSVRPLLTEGDLTAGPEAPGGWGAGDVEASKEWKDMKVTELGGLFCCDCCHRNGCNCGVKFPHLTGANYLWLTPHLYSSLCRLGHDLSEDAIVKLTE